jgi:hypothetical protein
MRFVRDPRKEQGVNKAQLPELDTVTLASASPLPSKTTRSSVAIAVRDEESRIAQWRNDGLIAIRQQACLGIVQPDGVGAAVEQALKHDVTIARRRTWRTGAFVPLARIRRFHEG